MKKITYKDLATLCDYKKDHRLERIGCNHYIKDNDDYVEVITKVKLPIYIALFIPACIFQAVALVFDGGLKEFEIESRTLHSKIVWKNSKCYKKFMEKD